MDFIMGFITAIDLMGIAVFAFFIWWNRTPDGVISVTPGPNERPRTARSGNRTNEKGNSDA